MALVTADLQVQAPEGRRVLTVEDLSQLPPGAATDLALEALRSVVAKDTTLSRVASQATLESVLAELRGKVEPADLVTLARASDVLAVRDRLPVSLGADGGLRVFPFDIGFAKESTLNNLLNRIEAVRALLAQPWVDPAEKAQRLGLAFSASSEVLTVAEGGNARLLISNSGTSGRTLHLQSLLFFASTGPVYLRTLVNPTTNLPTAALPLGNAKVGSAVLSSVVVAAGSGAALSGGVNYGLLAADRGQNKFDLSPITIPPGASLGINAPFQGAGDAVFTAYWYEEAI